MIRPLTVSVILGLVTLLVAMLAPARKVPAADTYQAAVDAARLLRADIEPGSWMSHGRTYGEQRFSPLNNVHAGNVENLELAWFADLDTSRKQEATPIVVDGAIYITTAWSKVKAFDAASGQLLWDYDPNVAREKAVDACCDVVNRGVAAWNGSIFAGTIDGRLIALDAETGDVRWQRMTVDADKPYTITGAPRVIKGQVIIGNGGAELGVRGYVSAYDAATGDLTWRFYTVPGNPALGFEQPALEEAARTWSGEWWHLGGGGTVWDSMAYDPGLDLLYIGTGNGSPWNHSIRSPGGGDNLFLSSIVALDPDDGSYRWHYQSTPAETWDYTATQHIIVADLEIDGSPRRVLMQAPKNGFFYVLDAASGELISAEPFASVNWATHIDLETGRPAEVPAARYDRTGRPFILQPSYMGAHNWHPMAYNPDTGLVYIPASDNAAVLAADAAFEINDQGWNTGTDYEAAMAFVESEGLQVPERTAYLLAWNPQTQREAWRVKHDDGQSVGGVLTTAGGLVFQGDADGNFTAYDALTGANVWSRYVQASIVAAPVAYEVNGRQYIAIVAGSSDLPESNDRSAAATTAASTNNSRLLVFRLGGDTRLPDLPVAADAQPKKEQPGARPAEFGDATMISSGRDAYNRYCIGCHGADANSHDPLVFPDLKSSPRLGNAEQWRAVLLDGELADNGMVSFRNQLTAADAEAIRAWVVQRANQAATKAP